MSRTFFSYFYHFYFVLFYFYFTGPERRSRSSSHQFNFLIFLLQRARDVSRALFSSFFIILLSSRALVLFFNYPFYFPGPEMRSQHVLGPLFHHFLFLFLLHRARDASCVFGPCFNHFFSLPRTRDVSSPFFYIFCHFFNITLHYTGLKTHLKP